MKKLLEKMQKVTQIVGNIERDIEIGYGKFKYKALSDNAVIQHVNKAESEVGLISIPATDLDLISNSVERTVNDKGRETLTYVDELRMTTRIYDIETEKSLDVISYARGIDSQDKGLGKAMTYARKYALLNAYKIPTGEELDLEKSKEMETASYDDVKAKVFNYFNSNLDDLQKTLTSFNLGSMEELSRNQVTSIYNGLNRRGKL